MDNLEVAQDEFRKEVQRACRSFLVWKHIDNFASDNADMREALKTNAFTWNVVTHSLQSTFLITLGRLFDSDGRSLTAETFLKMCIAKIDQFDREHIKARKMTGKKCDELGWLDGYMKDAHQTAKEDLVYLLGQVMEHKAVYSEVYAPIRSKIMAHKDRETIEKASELFAKTNIDQIQEMLNFLFQIGEIIWQLLYNGRLCAIGDFNFDEEERAQTDVEALLSKLAAK